MTPLMPPGLQTLPAARLYSVLDEMPRGNFRWTADVLAEFDGPHQESLSRAWLDTVKQSRARCVNGARESLVSRANTRLREFSERMKRADLVLTGTDSDLREWADARVTECTRIYSSTKDDGRRLRLSCAVVERYGLRWPSERLVSELDHPADLRPFFLRLQCPRWWRRQARRLQAVEVENAAREAGKVGRGRGLYVSDWTAGRVVRAHERNRKTLEKVIAENGDGQEFTLAELADKGVSNPDNRFNELMTRMHGFEQLADICSHVGEFWTLTTPSRFHCMKTTKASRKSYRNTKWEGLDPIQAQEFLCAIWARIRAALKREGIPVYGFRVVEPHHDGTPHWHMLLFMSPEHRQRARALAFRYCYKAEAPKIPAGKQWSQDYMLARFLPVEIDKRKGSATGYLAKYISKNINGKANIGERSDEDGQTLLPDAAGRVVAWASTYGLRQFQQIGGPSVTVWRELRRLGDEGLPGGDMFGGSLPWMVEQETAFEDLVSAADASDWCAYCIAMGAPHIPARQHIVKPIYMHEVRFSEEVNMATGEVVEIPRPPKTNAYGEVAAASVVGVVFAGLAKVATRFYEWTMRLARDCLDFSGGSPPALDLCQ